MKIRLVERTFVQYNGNEIVRYTIERTNSWLEFNFQFKFRKFVPYKILAPLESIDEKIDYSEVEWAFGGAVEYDSGTDYRKEVWFDILDEAVNYFNKLINEVHKYRGCIIYPFENGYYTVIREFGIPWGNTYSTYAAETIDKLHKKIDDVKFDGKKEKGIGKVKSSNVIKTAKIQL